MTRKEVNKILFEDIMEQRKLIKSGNYEVEDINARQTVIGNLFNVKNDLRQDTATAINVASAAERLESTTNKTELLKLVK